MGQRGGISLGLFGWGSNAAFNCRRRQAGATLRAMIDFAFIDVATVDFWYDHDYARSQHTLRQFSGPEWKELAKEWASQSLEWQERLAYILSDGVESRESDLLVDMYVAGTPGIAMSAAEGLRSMPLEQLRAAILRRRPSHEATRSASANELLRLITPTR